MKIRHFLYNSFLIESSRNKIAIDPGQYFSIFNFTSLIPGADWNSITHILITHGDPDHHWQSSVTLGDVEKLGCECNIMRRGDEIEV